MVGVALICCTFVAKIKCHKTTLTTNSMSISVGRVSTRVTAQLNVILGGRNVEFVEIATKVGGTLNEPNSMYKTSETIHFICRA